MKKFITLLLLVSIILISSYSGATEQWSSTKVYSAGQLVEWNGDIYIASHWNQGTEPTPNNINWDGWILIDENQLEEWTPRKVYHGGDIVSINERYYLAKWWSKDDYPESSEAWLHLKDIWISDGERPTPGENDTVIGIDNNHNGIRDDYERNIYKNYLNPEMQKIAISAGHEWQKLIERPTDDQITKNEVSIIFSNLISLRRCFTELRENDPSFKAPTQFFFNTLERAAAKRKAEELLARILGDDYSNISFPEKPCGNLATEVLK
ncbi:carbohydrate-binding protein [Vibrio metschnikovii]|uniref:carbohydrate-binding protein n=1 Tax=Vibrio metschnikovii TaxID=28172 RepID=UPI002FCBE6F6